MTFLYSPAHAAPPFAVGKSQLPFIVVGYHPIHQVRLQELVTEIHSDRYSTYSEDDRRLLWLGVTKKTPLIDLSELRLQSVPAWVVDSSILRLAQAVIWLTLRAGEEQLERFPGVRLDTQGENIFGWLSAIEEAKEDIRVAFSVRNIEADRREQAIKLDRLVSRFLAKQGTEEAETLPATLVNWLLTELRSSLPDNNRSEGWFNLLAFSATKINSSGAYDPEEVERLVSALELWQHPAILRIVALRQLRKKQKLLEELNFTSSEGSLDWIFAESPRKRAAAGFTLLSTATVVTSCNTAPAKGDSNYSELLLQKKAEISQKVQDKIAAILANRNKTESNK